MRYVRRVNLHRLAEERSLAYHRIVAQRLERDSAILDAARALANLWIERGGRSVGYAKAWREALNRPLAEIIALLEEDSEHARTLRQSSPFAGALTPAERWSVWRSTRQRFGPP